MLNCWIGFNGCALTAAMAGPYWGVIVGLCGIQLMTCVNAMDAAYPGCVPNNGRFHNIALTSTIKYQSCIE